MATLAIVPRNFAFRLPGCDVVLPLCHDVEGMAGCDVCLRKIAEFLADEMEFILAEAHDRPVARYRTELGEAWCTEQQASDLKLMTCSACYRASRLASDLALSAFVDNSPLITESDLPMWRPREDSGRKKWPVLAVSAAASAVLYLALMVWGAVMVFGRHHG